MDKELRKRILATAEKSEKARRDRFNGEPVPNKAFDSYQSLADWVNEHQQPVPSNLMVVYSFPMKQGGVCSPTSDHRAIGRSACKLVFTQPLSCIDGERLYFDIWIETLSKQDIPRNLVIWIEDPSGIGQAVTVIQCKDMFSLSGNNSGAYLFKNMEDAMEYGTNH